MLGLRFGLIHRIVKGGIDGTGYSTVPSTDIFGTGYWLELLWYQGHSSRTGMGKLPIFSFQDFPSNFP